MARAELDYRMLDRLANKAKEIEAMPPGPAREHARNDYQMKLVETAKTYEIPAEVIAPDAHLLGVLDWAEGLMRTGVGEPLRMAKAAKDYATGTPNSWTPGSTLSNIGSALWPFGEPARNTEYYIDESGLGSMIPDVRISDIPGMAKSVHNPPGWQDWYRVTPGGPVDVSLKGALGFAGDMGYSPKMVKALMGGEKKALSPVVQTGKMVRDEQAKYLDELAKQMSPSATSGFMDGLKALVVDPTQPLGEKIFRSRFKDADAAALKAGKMPVSDIMLESGAKGASSGAILKDMEAIIEQRQAVIDAITNQHAMAGGATLDELMHPLYSPEMAQALANPATANEALAILKEVEDRARASIAQNPRTPEWLQSKDPTMQRVFKKQAPQDALPIEKKTPYVSTGSDQPALPGMGVYPPKVGGGSGKDELYGMIGRAGNAPSQDLLDVAQPIYKLPETQQLKRDWQKKAFERGAFEPHNIADPVKAGEYSFGAKTYRDLGAHAGEKLEKELDRIEPGLGGQVARANQDISSLLEAAPTISVGRPPRGIPSGKPTTRTMRGLGGTGGMILSGVSDMADALKVPVGRGLMSPWTRYLVAPGARAAWLESIWDRQNDPEQGNPYALVYKHGVRP